jgi:hypothetical protein
MAVEPSASTMRWLMDASGGLVASSNQPWRDRLTCLSPAAVQNSPSRKSQISQAMETELRRTTVSFIQQAGKKLKLCVLNVSKRFLPAILTNNRRISSNQAKTGDSDGKCIHSPVLQPPIIQGARPFCKFKHTCRVHT